MRLGKMGAYLPYQKAARPWGRTASGQRLRMDAEQKASGGSMQNN